MLTVKTIECDGCQKLYEATDIEFMPASKGSQFMDHPDFRQVNQLWFKHNGELVKLNLLGVTAYVMNERGNTVAAYDYMSR